MRSKRLRRHSAELSACLQRQLQHVCSGYAALVKRSQKLWFRRCRAGEDGPRGRRLALPSRWGCSKQRRDTSRNRGRRIEPCHRPGAQGGQPVRQQRIMRAGQGHDVGAPRAISHETGTDLGQDRLIRDGLAAQMGFGQRGEARGPDQRDRAITGIAADQVMRVVRARRFRVLPAR